MAGKQICIVCGKEFVNKKHPKQKICSTECAGKYRKTGKTMISRTCPLCGKVFQFEKGRSDPMFCNRKCANAAKVNRITKKCEQCGDEFSVKPNRDYQRYCSLQCAGKAKEYKKIVGKCLHCGKAFEFDQCRPNVKYCSLLCKTTGSQKKKVAKKCKQCGTIFYSSDKSKKVYCSIKCFHESSDQKVECICETCGDKFFRHNYRSSRRYCSQQCFKRTKKPTSIELKVKAILDKLNVAYQQQVQFGDFICDFFVENSIVIEADGSYWHSLPSAIKRDERKNKYIQKCGYVMLRLTEQQINTDIETCESSIAIAIQRQKSSSGS